MIILTNVTKKFGEKKAVDSLSIEIKTGEVIGFLGVNGAGKTTTMRMITGVLKPTSGTVTVDGVDPLDHHISTTQKIGYLPENNPLYPDMKVEEYLQFIREVKKHGNYLEIAEKIGLIEVLDKKIETLSRGYRQRVGLTVALLGNPHILILDEPTSGLDPIEQDRIRALITELAKEKVIVFSTHILSEVEDIATRIIIINRGQKVYDGPKPKGKGAVEKLFKTKVLENEIK